MALTLDNSDRKAPSAFNETDVLEVTRRIERGAGSAYRSNGRDVRAKDVALIFADAATGAGDERDLPVDAEVVEDAHSGPPWESSSASE